MLALHVARKDLRHLWLPLAVWLFLLVLDLVLVGVLLGQVASVRAHRIVRVIGLVLPMLQTLLLIISVPLVVHEDPAVGTSASWLTRPIRRVDMVAAKVLSIGTVFIVLPTVVELMILLLHGASWQELRLGAAEIVLAWTSTAAPVATLAALTATFARFALVGATLTVGYVLASLGVLAASLYFGRTAADHEPLLALEASRGLIRSVLYIGFGSAVLIHQYMTRHTIQSVKIAATGVVLALAAGYWWPWNVLPVRTAHQSLPRSRFHVTVEMTPSHVAEPMMMPGVAQDRLQVLGHLRFGEIPEGLAGDAHVLRGRLTFSSGATIQFEGYEGSAGEPWLRHRWAPDLIRRVLGGVSFLNNEYEPTRPVLLSLVGRSDYQRYRGVDATYTASVNVSVLRYDVQATVPLMRRTQADQASSRVAVLTIERAPDGLVVFARETIIQLLFAGDVKWLGAAMWSELNRRVLYVLRHRDRGEALWPMPATLDDVDPISMFEGFSDSRLKQFLRRLTYRSPVPITDDWLRAAELVRIDATEVDVFSTEVRIDPFRLPPSLK